MKGSPGTSDALGLLGLARRAGGVTLGTERTRHALSAGEVRLMLVANDASERQLEKVVRLARHRDIPVRRVSQRNEVGRALGAGPLSVVGVTTRSFATQLLQLLSSSPPGSSEEEKLPGPQEERSPDAGS